MADVTIDPKTSALLIQDMQNDIVKSDRPVVPMGGPTLIANSVKLLEKARQVGMPVIYVQVVRRQDGRDAPRPALGSPPWREARPWSRARRECG
jgi:nicotinamidase-related amidase